MTSQTELSEKLMQILQQSGTKYCNDRITDQHITLMNMKFDLVYKRIYGFDPSEGSS